MYVSFIKIQIEYFINYLTTVTKFLIKNFDNITKTKIKSYRIFKYILLYTFTLLENICKLIQAIHMIAIKIVLDTIGQHSSKISTGPRGSDFTKTLTIHPYFYIISINKTYVICIGTYIKYLLFNKVLCYYNFYIKSSIIKNYYSNSFYSYLKNMHLLKKLNLPFLSIKNLNYTFLCFKNYSTKIPKYSVINNYLKNIDTNQSFFKLSRKIKKEYFW